ncbi:ABC transporter, ATP-binding protein [Leptospira interrogans serovar Canicola]|nr:ABC transporter, ATP-binding protein [Leptospira interrogans serovar Canicola]
MSQILFCENNSSALCFVVSPSIILKIERPLSKMTLISPLWRISDLETADSIFSKSSVLKLFFKTIGLGFTL